MKSGLKKLKELQKNIGKLWNKVFGFSVGDRVKFKTFSNKSWIYGDVVGLSQRDNIIVLFVKLRDGVVIWSFPQDLVKVQRRRKKKDV